MRVIYFHSIARRKVRRSAGLSSLRPLPARRWLVSAIDAMGRPSLVRTTNQILVLDWVNGTSISVDMELV